MDEITLKILDAKLIRIANIVDELQAIKPTLSNEANVDIDKVLNHIIELKHNIESEYNNIVDNILEESKILSKLY